MSALEKFSVEPVPVRHSLWAVPAADDVADGLQPKAIDALIRLAERLLPSLLFVLHRGDPADGVITWPGGIMGRRVSLEPVARLLLTRCDPEMEVWLPDLTADQTLSTIDLVAAAGPLAFARVPFPGENCGGSLAALRECGEWTEEERAKLRDLATAIGAEYERTRLVGVAEAAVREAEELSARLRELSNTRLHEAQGRVSERMNAVGPLLTGVCHELNNPLTSIRSFAELLLLDVRTEEDREALEIVQREALRASRIVADLRMVARRRAGQSVQRDLVDVNEVVEAVLRGRARELAMGGIECLQDLAAVVPPVRVVRLHLEQVVSHLISNAVKAVEGLEGKRCITITTRGSSARAFLTVGDSGSGISPERLGHVFDPLWTDREPGEGSAFGLSLVQNIVAEHDGLITAESRPGRGSLFTVELPGAAELVDGSDTAANQGLRILVVDDEATIRYSLARYMERRGHDVDQAEDGKEALRMVDEAAARRGYDIVIADLRMPGIDGDRLLECLRTRGDGLENRLVLMTGETNSAAGVTALQQAGVPVMRKPFELAEVAQIIEAHAGLLV